MGHINNPAAKKQAFKEKMKAQRKDMKQQLKEKRAKLIVKNLPFKATEENLREYFEKFGKVKDIMMLKKEDKKLVGCGFVQYEAVQPAAKARHHTNGKDFLGRKLEVDFAMAKDRYLKKVKDEKRKQRLEEVEVKEEPVDVDLSLLKEEKDEDSGVDVNKDNKNDDTVVKYDETEEDEESDEDSDDSDESDESEVEEVKSVVQEDKKPKVESNDVTEGKTVFIKNVPFDATKDDLRECMQQFGPVYYALVCVDPMTEHSKGTAFVKFKEKEDADKCLEAGTELTLLGNILDPHPALSRNDLKNKSTNNEKKKQDSRNLYLVKEGVILAGTKAAEGVSSADMSKRLQLEQYKTQMLKNLNMFVSRNRLIIHNLPAAWDDSKLRELVKKHAGAKAVIREAKIMRNMRNVDANGIGASKEHGFVTLTSHEHALNVLRSLNNNPNIFTATKRPIVAFSIENKVMVKAKEKRMERSQKRNPLAKQYDPKELSKQEKHAAKESLKNGKQRNEKFNRKSGKPVQIKEGSEYTGVAARPGIQKMRSKYNLKTQAQAHFDNLKKAKAKKKMAKKTVEERRRDAVKQPKQKINKKKAESDNFSKMVNDYKVKLNSAISSKTMKTGKKWYE